MEPDAYLGDTGATSHTPNQEGDHKTILNQSAQPDAADARKIRVSAGVRRAILEFLPHGPGTGRGEVYAVLNPRRAGGNRERLGSEAAFAALGGVNPIPASSGKTHRHRLNRAGDRQANAALYAIALCRMRNDPRTGAYVQRRTREGPSELEIVRCIKLSSARGGRVTTTG